MKRELIAVGLLASLPCARAHAFQSPARFIAAAAEGGGGGRFFSGAPTDSLTCDVCHGGRPAVPVDVLGLPVHGYVPGQTYRVVVDWDDSLNAVALNLEVTDELGHAFGTLTAPPPEMLSPADLCNSTGSPDVVVGTGARQLALVAECGGHQASLLWQAPTQLTNRAPSVAWLSGSIVAADGDGTVEGDAVTNLSRTFTAARDAAALAEDVSAGCSVRAVPGRNASNSALLAGLCSLIGFARRRRAQHQRPQ